MRSRKTGHRSSTPQKALDIPVKIVDMEKGQVTEIVDLAPALFDLHNAPIGYLGNTACVSVSRLMTSLSGSFAATNLPAIAESSDSPARSVIP